MNKTAAFLALLAVTGAPVAPLPRLSARSRAHSWNRVGVPNDIVRLYDCVVMPLASVVNAAPFRLRFTV